MGVFLLGWSPGMIRGDRLFEHRENTPFSFFYNPRATAMNGERLQVVVLDRPSWYIPELESQELSRANAVVVNGWITQDDHPAEAGQGYPFRDLSREEVSRITAAHVPPHLMTAERVVRMAKEAVGILVVRANITAEVLDALPRLRVIGRYGIGVDNIEVDAATQRGVAVLNTPGFCVREVADHTMLLLLACSRKCRMLDGMMRRGEWGRDQASPMPALYRQTLGLIGFGQIAREVTVRATTFGLTVIAYDAYVDSDEIKQCGAQPVQLVELLEKSDFVSVHAPLTAATRHLLGEAELRAMKRSAFLINTARGPLVDERALIAALQQGWIAGAALDVFAREPLEKHHPLLGLDNVLLTPHIGGLSDEGQVACRRRLAAAMASVLTGKWPDGSELYNRAVMGRAAVRS